MSTLQVYSLAQFTQQHAQQVRHCAQQLAQFSEAAFDIVQAACRDDLVVLQQHLETFSVRADGNAPAPAAATHPMLPTSPAGGKGTGHISVAELLKSRSTCRQQKSSTTPTGSSTKGPGEPKSAQQVCWARG